ncbi:hypothetical protein D1816_01505 [Aquimarina sp. AD10]|uniref:ParB/Sulfiredoxin domain-containing protein n=1 Tax=Aquimarina aggregata TaxID=1642818 RepID=A0A163BKG9_9FLAO|nr:MULTISPECIES: hypothetical protein [Aquimarina]AXT59080.1 hypothetical protein D1816_01505 [Aquimarina sp. AD10]KZS41490.1 hypothetical protein AWE51_20990 [Aquimarina aggregata]RKM93413.1 hypothetical protein D7033_19960 [Aquimarina sp. AD10]
MKKIRIIQELKEHIVPLSKEEYHLLSESIISEGCREALLVWEKDDDLILIDGHNRYQICTDHNIKYKTKKMIFSSIEDVKFWMLNNQLGRRNLNPDQLSYYRGLKYCFTKKSRGGYANVESKGQIELSTSKLLSKEFNVSESTIKRDEKYTMALNLIGDTNPKLKLQILMGEIRMKKSDLAVLLQAQSVDDWIIVNESDLRHKIKITKEDLERKKSISEFDKIDTSSSYELVNGVDTLFLDQDSRLNLIKGKILSAVNSLIKNRDKNSLKLLKKQINKLELEILHTKELKKH